MGHAYLACRRVSSRPGETGAQRLHQVRFLHPPAHVHAWRQWLRRELRTSSVDHGRDASNFRCTDEPCGRQTVTGALTSTVQPGRGASAWDA